MVTGSKDQQTFRAPNAFYPHKDSINKATLQRTKKIPVGHVTTIQSNWNAYVKCIVHIQTESVDTEVRHVANDLRTMQFFIKLTMLN